MPTLTQRKIAELLPEAHGVQAYWGPGHDHVLVPTQQVLDDHLEYAPDWQRRFTRFARHPKRVGQPWDMVIMEFAGRHAVPTAETRGITRANSFEFDNLLDEQVMWTQFPADTGETVVLLQVHLGGDIRSHWSDPVVFVLDDPDAWLTDVDVSLRCNHCLRWWSDDNGTGVLWHEHNPYTGDLVTSGSIIDLDAAVRTTDDTQAVPCPSCDTALVPVMAPATC